MSTPRKVRVRTASALRHHSLHRKSSRYRALHLETLEDRATPAGLVAAFSMDAGGGTTVSDTSGNANHGTISGAVWTAFGKYGSALAFDGNNDLVTISDANSLDLTTGMTLEAWVFPTETNHWETVIFKERSGGLAYALYGGAPSNGPPASYITRSGTGSDIGADGLTALPNNVWSHLASTYDGTTIRLYVNGTLVRSQAAAGSITVSSNPLRIGGNAIWGEEAFGGRIDEVRVYDRVLSAAEIAVDMATPIGTVQPPPPGDSTPPLVSAVTPAMGTTSVATGSNLTVAFDEAMTSASITSSTIELRDPANNLVPATVTYSAANNTATIDPAGTLATSTLFFTATVRGGASGVKDAAGNALAADLTWSFSTGTPQFQENVVFSGLINPTVVKFAPDGRIFVAEKSGLIKVFDNLSDTTATVFADLRTNVYNAWDRGLLGMTLSPDFATNPYIYVLYTLDAHTNRSAPVWGTPGASDDPLPNPPGATGNGVVVDGRIARIPVLANGTAGTEQVILEKQWLQQFPSHSVGSLAFGPDGALYASAGDGASFNYVDYGQAAVNVDARNPSTMGDPANEGGALRSLDLLSPSDPTSLDGTIIRIDPATAAPLSTNPLFVSGNDTNAKRIIAFGLRNPFRIAFRPGTSELWVGDVGWSTYEEINRIKMPTDALVENFGWPAYEGPFRQSGYDGANMPLMEGLYAQEAANPDAHIEPYFAYDHSDRVVTGSSEPTGSSAIAGLAFGQGGNLRGGYDGALFFTDYNRDTIWVMYRGVNGLPDPASRKVFYQSGGNPLDAVNLEIAPDGSLFFPDFDSGQIRRVRMVGENQPPLAAIQTSATSGAAPLLVNFSAAGSSDPDGNPLSYAWDLDGDGQFDDSTAVAPSFNYVSPSAYNVQLRVTDSGGLSDVEAVSIVVGNRPVPTIDAPLANLLFQSGANLSFAGHATDPDQVGNLPASALTWTFSFYQAAEEDPSNINLRNRQTFAGVASGTYTLPDWEHPVHLIVELTATDATGISSTTSVRVDPQTVNLTFDTVPSGLAVTLNGRTKVTPYTRTWVVGSQNTIGVVSPQVLGVNRYTFGSWSNGGALSHLITAPATPQTYIATFSLAPTPTGLVGIYAFDTGIGTTLADTSGSGNNGTIAGATWTTSGKYGGALSFDGDRDMVTIADANSLDLTNGMTLEAWVYPTQINSWETIIFKERSGGIAYSLYAGAPGGGPPASYITRAGTGGDIGADGLTALPLNTWSHLAGTYDGTTIRLYVNGLLVRSQAAAGSIMVSTNPLRFGANTIWGEEDYAGRIDEVRIYNRALSLAEIAVDMVTPVASLPVAPLSASSFSATVDTAPPAARLDINSDGQVTPLDAALVINRLNALARALDDDILAPFYDPSGDDRLTPLDALLIVNYLNAPRSTLPSIIDPHVPLPLSPLDESLFYSSSSWQTHLESADTRLSDGAYWAWLWETLEEDR